MTANHTRRGFLKQGSGAIGGFALTVVAGGAVAQAKTKVRFSDYVESEEQLGTTLKVLEAYMAKNSDVEIIPEFSNFRSFTDKLATEAAGGNAPDMREAGGCPPADVAAQAGDNSASLGIVCGRSAMLIQMTDSYVGIGALMEDPLDLHMLPNGHAGGEMKNTSTTTRATRPVPGQERRTKICASTSSALCTSIPMVLISTTRASE